MIFLILLTNILLIIHIFLLYKRINELEIKKLGVPKGMEIYTKTINFKDNIRISDSVTQEPIDQITFLTCTNIKK